jgi:hypothetical protein
VKISTTSIIHTLIATAFSWTILLSACGDIKMGGIVDNGKEDDDRKNPDKMNDQPSPEYQEPADNSNKTLIAALGGLILVELPGAKVWNPPIKGAKGEETYTRDALSVKFSVLTEAMNSCTQEADNEFGTSIFVCSATEMYAQISETEFVHVEHNLSEEELATIKKSIRRLVGEQ